MSDAPWHFDEREPSTAATVISEADILKAADALAEFVRDYIDHDCYDCEWMRDPSTCENDCCENVKAMCLIEAYEKARKGRR